MKFLKWLRYNFIPQAYVKLSYGGCYAIFPDVETAIEMIEDGDDEEDYKIEIVKMTEKRFESLPEFNGF